MTSTLKIEDLHVAVAGTPILKGVYLEIRTGEILKGSVIKVIRYSETAGISMSYRLVVD